MIPDYFNLREEYKGEEINLRNTPYNPFELFLKWIKLATKLGLKDPNAMILSTSDKTGKVYSRVVLMKEVTEKGFVFFTNYQSAKGIQIKQNSNVSLLFFWKEFYQQVRIEGYAERISNAASDEYFDSRPLESRINAIVSPQSKEIENKDKLKLAGEKISEQFGNNISRPEYWGGYLVKPESFEFWQGQPNRLHDRIVYMKQQDSWKKKCLAP